MNYVRRSLFILLLVSVAAYGEPKQREVKVQKSSISREQEIEIGKQAAADVEREMDVVNNAKIEAWLNQLGQQLAKTPEANEYPYYFKLVKDDSINAFALPGGPMFVHTGLITAADNEAQVAGVLAHEMSHVALRHGVSQMGRTQKWQSILGLAGAAAGMASGGATGALIGTAVNTGGQLGVGGLLSKYSRDNERDADLNGARMLASAGYDPLEMAKFFAKLEEELGDAARPKGLDAWFASHPSPGNRVEAVQDDIRFYPAKKYTSDSGEFAEIKQLVASLPPAKMRPAVALTPVQAVPRRLPNGFVNVETRDFAIGYPGQWQAGQVQQGGSIYLIPNGGAAKGRSGGIELIVGGMLDYYSPQGASGELDAATKAFLQSLEKGDSNLKVGTNEAAKVGGKDARLVRLTTRSSYAQDPAQAVELYTVVRPAGLWTLVLAAPHSRFAEAQPIFQQMVQTVEFLD